MAVATLKVYGMTCTLCSATIEARFDQIDGVERASVSYAAEKAVVEYDEQRLDLERKARIDVGSVFSCFSV